MKLPVYFVLMLVAVGLGLSRALSIFLLRCDYDQLLIWPIATPGTVEFVQIQMIITVVPLIIGAILVSIFSVNFFKLKPLKNWIFGILLFVLSVVVMGFINFGVEFSLCFSLF